MKFHTLKSAWTCSFNCNLSVSFRNFQLPHYFAAEWPLLWLSRRNFAAHYCSILRGNHKKKLATLSSQNPRAQQGNCVEWWCGTSQLENQLHLLKLMAWPAIIHMKKNAEVAVNECEIPLTHTRSLATCSPLKDSLCNYFYTQSGDVYLRMCNLD